MKSIHFHNWGRKGDLHVSRSFVKRLAAEFRVPAYYHHNESPAILADLPGVEHVRCTQEQNKKRAYSVAELKDGELWVNTWYGAGEHKYRDKEVDDLISFDTLYRLFDHVSRKFLNKPLNHVGPPRSFLPHIGWNAFPATATARDRLHARARSKRVFVDTVKCLSGQAKNFPLVPVVRNAAMRRPDVTFYYTWGGPFARASMPHNAIWTRAVHGISEALDLTENAFIAGYCDVIVGRNSSSYTFALNHDNILSNKRFLEFSTLPCPVLIGPMLEPLIKAPCSITQSRTTSRDEAVSLLLKEIESL